MSSLLTFASDILICDENTIKTVNEPRTIFPQIAKQKSFHLWRVLTVTDVIFDNWLPANIGRYVDQIERVYRAEKNPVRTLII